MLSGKRKSFDECFAAILEGMRPEVEESLAPLLKACDRIKRVEIAPQAAEEERLRSALMPEALLSARDAFNRAKVEAGKINPSITDEEVGVQLLARAYCDLFVKQVAKLQAA